MIVKTMADDNNIVISVDKMENEFNNNWEEGRKTNECEVTVFNS